MYTLRTTCRNRRYSSSLVPVSVEITAGRIPGTSFVICSNQSRYQQNTESRQLKILLVLRSALFIEPTAFWTQKAVGLDCCSIPSILYFFVHSIQKSVFCPSTLSSLFEACYRDWHTFGVPEIWLVHLSMKKPLKNRGFL